MKRVLLILAVLCSPGCSDRPSPESGAVTGAVVGGAAGAVVGNDLGNTGVGAAAGAVTGATVGAVVGSQNDDKKQIIQYQQEIIHGQQKQVFEQGKELDQIKRQEYWDEKLQKYRQ